MQKGVPVPMLAQSLSVVHCTHVPMLPQKGVPKNPASAPQSPSVKHWTHCPVLVMQTG
jgi:hypothetical protein